MEGVDDHCDGRDDCFDYGLADADFAGGDFVDRLAAMILPIMIGFILGLVGLMAVVTYFPQHILSVFLLSGVGSVAGVALLLYWR